MGPRTPAPVWAVGLKACKAMSLVYNTTICENDTITLKTGLLLIPSRGRSVHELLLTCQSPQRGILSTHLKFQTDRIMVN